MWGMKKTLFYQGALTKNNFWIDAFKLEKDGQIFPFSVHVHPGYQ